jgi:hypothetical protein
MHSNVNFLNQNHEKAEPRFIPADDFSKIFYEANDPQAKEGVPRIQNGALNSSGFSQDELGLISALSPMVRFSPFSPTRGAGLSFYEAFTKRFESKKTAQQDEGSRTNKLEFKPFSRINSSVSENPVDVLDKNASTSVFNYLNSSNNSLRDIMNDRMNQLNEVASPLRLELWRIDDAGQSNSPKRMNSPLKSNTLNLGLRPIRTVPDISKAEPEIVKLKALCQALESVFMNNVLTVQKLQSLSKFDEEILNSLLQRKFAKRLTNAEMELPADRRAELITDIINSKSHKRPEECYKFVLTRVIKYLKKKLKDTAECPADVESYLYELYFKDTAQRLSLPITDFHYPLTGQRGKFKLNSVYFDKIFKSEKFLEGISDYINNVLYHEYRGEIAKKIESLLVRWDEQLQDQTGNVQEIERSIKEYLLKNKRCKLPWTMKEVNESIERFIVLIKNYRSK